MYRANYLLLFTNKTSKSLGYWVAAFFLSKIFQLLTPEGLKAADM